MTDFVERLRRVDERWCETVPGSAVYLCEEAADELARLTAALAEREGGVERLTAEIKTHVAAVLHVNDLLRKAEAERDEAVDREAKSAGYHLERIKELEAALAQERSAHQRTREEWNAKWGEAGKQRAKDWQDLPALRAQRCGTCADWRKGADCPDAACVSAVSRCADSRNDDGSVQFWPADHGCPHHRRKEAK